MYGLVNQAVEDLAIQLGGRELWRRIHERASIDVEAFIAMEAYDDAITYRLVEAASDVLGLSQEAVLEAFGEHWVLYTGQVGYGPLFAAMGKTLPEFLRNLDAMHARIALSMPKLVPPSFFCEELGDEQLLVRYWSERKGLAPMVRGLLKGLGPFFGLEVVVTQVADATEDADHQQFLVTYRASETVLERDAA